jgi:polysaccharide pyruvyl transferase WcaK-like protein
METSKMRIAFFGNFGVGNIGNEASLLAALNIVGERYPLAQLIVVCPNPEMVAAEHGVEAVNLNALSGRSPAANILEKVLRKIKRRLISPFSWLSIYFFLRDVDIMIVPGTGILDDFKLGPSSPWPRQIHRWSFLTRVSGTLLFFAGIGAGPIDHPRYLSLMTLALSCCDECSYRDQVSLEFMESVGRDTSRDKVTADIVFSFLTRETIDEEVEVQRKGLRVGLGLMSYNGWSDKPEIEAEIYENYLSTMVGFTHHILGLGHSISLLTGDRADQPTVDNYLSRIEVSHSQEQLFLSPINDFHSLRIQIRECDVVVATRYHNAIAALMEGKPVLAVGYAEKFRELLARFGLSDYALTADHISDARMIECFSMMTLNRDILVQQIERRLVEERELAMQSFSFLDH